jgi:NADH-quinone oxidoreductase subunit G
VDLCPTGVFTDKTARFRARYWDYDMAPSVCPHCSLGCNTIPAARYRELLKIVARRNEAVNGWFICDRGRFTDSGVNDPARPRYPLVDRHRVGWDEALDALMSAIRKTAERYGAESLAVVGSSRLSMEAASLLHLLLDSTGAGTLCYLTYEREAAQAKTAISYLNMTGSASMADVREADLIALADCNLLQDGPMMALAVRQAWRKGAKIYLLDTARVEDTYKGLPFDWSEVASLADIPFADAENPVIVCGGDGKEIAGIVQAFECGAKSACLLDGPNAFGAALLSGEYGGITLERAVADGRVKGIIAIEADIPANLLEGIPFVAALDWRNTDTVKAAGIVLPTTAWVEMDGTFVNNEGRAQRFKKVMQPGLPLKGLDPSLHPPRLHTNVIPGGNLHPAWKVVADIIERFGAGRDVEPLSGKWQRLRELDAEGEGMLLSVKDMEIQGKHET